jgi:hypothetical protein
MLFWLPTGKGGRYRYYGYKPFGAMIMESEFLSEGQTIN